MPFKMTHKEDTSAAHYQPDELFTHSLESPLSLGSLILHPSATILAILFSVKGDQNVPGLLCVANALFRLSTAA
jgi:hypothetical protein